MASSSSSTVPKPLTPGLTFPFTSAQKAKYQRCIRRCNTFTVKAQISITIMENAIDFLNLVPITDDATEVPSNEELIYEFRSILPQTQDLFTAAYFASPTTPIAVLRDIAILYKLPDPSLELTILDLDVFEQNHHDIKLHVWLAAQIYENPLSIQRVVDKYRATISHMDQIDHQPLDATTPPANNYPLESPRTFATPAALFQRDRDPAMVNVTRRPLRETPANPLSSIPPARPLPQHENNNRNTPSIPPRQEDNDTPSTAPTYDNSTKYSTSIANYFKDRRFTGGIDDSIILTIRDYDNLAQQINLSHADKSTFFVNCFNEPARTFFFLNASLGQDYQEMVTLMLREYDSDARRLEVQTRMDNLNLRTFMKEKAIEDEREGLQTLLALLDRLSPQCQPSFRNDAYKLRILSVAVATFEWSITPRTQLLSQGLNYNSFKSALFGTMSLLKESNQLQASSVPTSELINTNYGQYAQQPYNRYNNNRTNTYRNAQFNNNFRNNNRQPNYNNQQYATNNNRPSNYSNQKHTFSTRRNQPVQSEKPSCRRCGFVPWAPGHKCATGSIRSYVTQRLTDGDNPAHVMGELVAHAEMDEEESPPIFDHEQTTSTFLANFHETLHNETTPTPEEQHTQDQTPYIAEPSISNPDDTIVSQFIHHSFHCAPSDFSTNYIPTPPPTDTIPPTSETDKIDCTHINLNNTHLQHLPATPSFCVDSGAPRSVIGLSTFNKFMQSLCIKPQPLRPSPLLFAFAAAQYKSLGQAEFNLDTPHGTAVITVKLDVVDADIPALVGLDILDANLLMIDNINHKLARRTAEKHPITNVLSYVELWFIPLTRGKSGHLYAQLKPTFLFSVNFTRDELMKLHRQFFHPSAGKLFALLKRARPDEADPETLRILIDIGSRCDPCQRIQNAPLRFRASFGSDSARFNERIFMDVVFLFGYPVLHIVDEGTKYSAATRLLNQSTSHVWSTLLRCWSAIYTGMPNRIIVDQGTNFGQSFVRLAEQLQTSVEHTGIEAHHSLGIGERYHQPLRTTMRKMLLEQPKADFDLCLALAVKAMNDTLGPEGLVPTVLVFGDLPKLTTKSAGPRPSTDERASLAELARTEMAQLMAQMRIKRALHHQTPTATDRSYEPGDLVLIWREKLVNNRIGEFIGPFPVTSFNRATKIVCVRDPKTSAVLPFNVTQVKPYVNPAILSSLFLQQLLPSLQHFQSPNPTDDIFMTEILLKSDPRAQTPAMTKARRLEMENLLKRGTFKVVLKEEVPPNANILPGRFVLAIKSTTDGMVKYKARFVIGGHRDKLKDFMVHSSQTLQPQSIRLLLALATAFGFNIWTSDVTQAYLQSALPLARDLFLDSATPELELRPDQCMQLLRPLYGLCESGDLWFHTLARHHAHDLKMQHLKSDSSFHYLMVNGSLCGLSGCYVDDLLRAGNENFKQLAQLTRSKFDMAPDEPLPADFSGFRLESLKGLLQQSQQHYLKKLENLDSTASFSDFRSMRMKLAWLSHTRPDCSFEISRLAQITEESFRTTTSKCITTLNKATSYARNNNISILFPQLDSTNLHLYGYADASFANNFDMSSQLGYVIFLGDVSDNVIPLSFRSYKARRICRSAMAAEIIAFSDMFDASYTLANEISTLTSRTVPLKLFTDNKSLFDTISKGSRTSEKRLMLDIYAAREAYKSGAISDIGFVRSQFNLADGLTKPMSQAALRQVLASGKHTPTCEQWILRPTEPGLTD